MRRAMIWTFCSKRVNDVPDILQSKTLDVDADMSGHITVFIFPRVCFVT